MRIPKLSDVFARRTDPFRLSVSEARSKYKDLQNEMIKGLGLDVEWKYKDLTGTGSGGNTRDNMDGTALVKLDCPILARLEAGEDVGRIAIPGKDVVRQTIAQCHEIRHLWQFVDARQPSGDPVQAVRIACSKFNPFWYCGDRDGYQQNYWHDPTEIRAERSGIVDCRNRLKIMFTGSNVEEGDRAILEYVESRCFVHRDGKRLGQADYFIELPMDWNMEQASVNRVLKLFDKAVVEARKHAPKYNIWDRTCSFDKGRCKGDEFCQTVHVTQDGASPWEVPYRMLDNAKNEQEALDVIGAVTLLNHPNLFGIYRALEQVRGRLSPDTVFGNGFLERVTRYDKDRGAAPLYLSTLDDASDDDGELAPHRRS